MPIDGDSVAGCIAESLASVLLFTKNAAARERIYTGFGVDNKNDFAQKVAGLMDKRIERMKREDESNNDNRSILVIRNEYERAAELSGASRTLAKAEEDHDWDSSDKGSANDFIMFSSDSEAPSARDKTIGFSTDDDRTLHDRDYTMFSSDSEAPSARDKTISFSTDDDRTLHDYQSEQTSSVDKSRSEIQCVDLEVCTHDYTMFSSDSEAPPARDNTIGFSTDDDRSERIGGVKEFRNDTRFIEGENSRAAKVFDVEESHDWDSVEEASTHDYTMFSSDSEAPSARDKTVGFSTDDDRTLHDYGSDT
ncbi:hypothetical protein QR680_014601 [Steinernema hermaphroditum]|uniref:Uncharacterized protein n=1 Tax=Steinernema hermaphroditum TaxID=289476 RepID=A0AA39I9I4_9BILA|nr:hypothetical protein QR680_014601 [Steinernema hermaphroditum]